MPLTFRLWFWDLVLHLGVHDYTVISHIVYCVWSDVIINKAYQHVIQFACLELEHCPLDAADVCLVHQAV